MKSQLRIKKKHFFSLFFNSTQLLFSATKKGIREFIYFCKKNELIKKSIYEADTDTKTEFEGT